MHPSSAQYAYIIGYMNEAERAIHTPGDLYEDYFDVDALVSWYLINELFKNNDSKIESVNPGSRDFTTSVMMYKPRNGKLVLGPLWDFDLAAGNVNFHGNDVPTGWWVRLSEWYGPLFERSSFGQHVFSKWCQLERDGNFASIGASIESIVTGIGPAAIERNFDRWRILGVQVWPNSYVGATHEEEVEHVKRWLDTRVSWMDTEFEREFGPCPTT